MRDPQHGGYFSKVTDAGAPKDTRKHAYLNSQWPCDDPLREVTRRIRRESEPMNR